MIGGILAAANRGGLHRRVVEIDAGVDVYTLTITDPADWAVDTASTVTVTLSDGASDVSVSLTIDQNGTVASSPLVTNAQGEVTFSVTPTGGAFVLTASASGYTGDTLSGSATVPAGYNEPAGLTLWYHMDGTNNPAAPPNPGFDNGVISSSGWSSTSGALGPQGQFKIVQDGAISTDDFIVNGVATAVPVNPTGAGSSLRIGHRGFGGAQHTAGQLSAGAQISGWPVETTLPSSTEFQKFYVRWVEYTPTDIPHPPGKRFFFRTGGGVADMFPDWSYTGAGMSGKEGFIRLVAQGQAGSPVAAPTEGVYNRGEWHTTEIYMARGEGVSGSWLLQIWVDGVKVVDSVAGLGYHETGGNETIDQSFQWLPGVPSIDGVSFYPNTNSLGHEHDNALLGEVYVSVEEAS